jgi:hypothetical protein
LKKKTKGFFPSFWIILGIVAALIIIDGVFKVSSGLGKSNSAELLITQFAEKNGYTLDDYPEEIVEMLMFNDETKDFVIHYPENADNFKPEKLDFTKYKNCKEPPLLLQWDSRWGYMRYNGKVFGLSGSAPTCLSMAAIYLTQDVSMTPVHFAEVAKNTPYETNPEMMLSDNNKVFNYLKVKDIDHNQKRFTDAVKEDGSVVICLMKKSQDFSEAIVVKGIDKNNKFLINDPGSKKRSETAYTYSQLDGEIRKIWKVSRKENNEK